MDFELFRDDYGVPHVRADSVLGVSRGQGYAMGTDRAWQLDLLRMRCEGTVAAATGAGAVEWDTFARRALIVDTARRAHARLDDETRAFVAGYVDGVNQAIARAPEHDALGVDPVAWQPWTPLAVFLVQHLLFASFPSKLWRQFVKERLGDEGLAFFRHEGMQGAGSNAFAVGGARTASGLPLVAGDPHRSFEAPNIYAQVRLACPEFDVAGFCFVGVPGIQHFAHAGSVAWAITNAMADYQDLFVEDDPEALDVHQERLEVRGGPPVVVETAVSPRGPLVVESYSLRTSSYALGDLGFASFLPLLRARTVDDVDRAFDTWVEPVNNVVAADTAGAVLHRVAGRVPERPVANRKLPVTPDQAWTGWVTDLPRTWVAPDGQVVTANQRVSPDYDRIGDDFAAPFRADRITALLTGRVGLTVADLAAVLADVHSEKTKTLMGDDWPAEMDERGGPYIARRDALVARLAEHPALAPVAGGSPYGALYEPWFGLPYRLGHCVNTLLAADKPLGIDVRALVGDEAATTWPHTFYAAHGFDVFGIDDPLVDALRAATTVPVLGDSDCVRSNHSVPGSGVAARGPVARYVWDLADRDNSRWVVPLGASGLPGPHQHDQLGIWAEGGTVPLVTAWDRLRREVLDAD